MKKQKGFTLVELVMGMVVLSVAVGALIAGVTAMVRQSVLPEIINTSTYLAEREMERVTSQRFSKIGDEASTAFAAPFGNYSYEVEVDAVPGAIANDPGMNEYKQVKITVSHPQGGSIDLTTIATRN
jgi:prepilin-type N-terminal cleavage/methylation domain-containing protein